MIEAPALSNKDEIYVTHFRDNARAYLEQAQKEGHIILRQGKDVRFAVIPLTKRTPRSKVLWY